VSRLLDSPRVSAATSLCPVCILAGGRGTRLGEQVRDLPKPLIEVAGEPFLFHQLRLLRSHDADRVVLCVGYLGELIERAVGDGQAFGLRISYSYDSPDLDGTAGAVRRALDQLGDEFMVLYGDTYLRIDYRDVERAFRASGLPALMTVLRNEGRWDTSNAVYRDGRVISHDKRHPSPDMRWIDYGLGALHSAALDVAPEEADLAELYAELARRGLLAGYEATERFYEIGTPESMRETELFLRRTRAN
jgi:NDP-sugar pyrophosphorylase family protein